MTESLTAQEPRADMEPTDTPESLRDRTPAPSPLAALAKQTTQSFPQSRGTKQAGLSRKATSSLARNSSVTFSPRNFLEGTWQQVVLSRDEMLRRTFYESFLYLPLIKSRMGQTIWEGIRQGTEVI